MIRVVLGHRGTLVRGALAAVLAGEKDLQVVAEVDSANSVLASVARMEPHVVVLDPALANGAGVAEFCVRLGPGGVLVLVDRDNGGTACRELARQAPRIGFIATDASPRELVDAVRRVAGGEPVLDPLLAMAALNAHDSPLTDREREVLELLTTGATAREIARSLSLSAGTVRNHS